MLGIVPFMLVVLLLEISHEQERSNA